MPVYRLGPELAFPHPEQGEPGGLLAVGGDLEPERLLLAYSAGIFPWYEQGQPILWHSPDPRAVLRPEALRVSRSLGRTLRRGRYEVRLDTAFEAVVRGCAEAPRPGGDGTWITADMQRAYLRLHELGFAHSAEAWEGERLAGGLYGVSLGGVFFGESMFAARPDASKVAFAVLVRQLTRWGFDLVDCQMQTSHLERFGAELWPRRRFLETLARALERETRRGRWCLAATPLASGAPHGSPAARAPSSCAGRERAGSSGLGRDRRRVSIRRAETEAPMSSARPAPLPATGPNAQQIEYWNETTGPRWVALQERLDAQIEPLGLQVMERTAVSSGERALDVGCGCGQTSLQLARRVGPDGSVLGIDISAVMLARAADRAREARLRHLEFANADAQTHDFGSARFDLLFSRFGVMFFADPRAAFENLRRALAPEGRLAFASWQELGRNPWMRDPTVAAAALLELPPPPPPGSPGPFAFADAERVTRILEDAGFVDVAHEPVTCRLSLGGGGGVEDAVHFMLQIGPVAAALREAPEARRDAVASAVAKVLRAHETDEGIVMDGAFWIVTARNPG
jgi:leucyl/phenylalanyl-tRNA--protein transferase